MSAIRELLWRLWGTIRRNRSDRDLESELKLHLDLAREEAALRGESGRSARLRAGGAAQTMDVLRDQRGLPWIEDLVRDARHGLAMLARNPGFTAVAVVTLALGIGANTAIFSVVDAVLLEPLPYEEPDRLVSAGFLMAGEYLLVRDEARSVESIALYMPDIGVNLSVDDQAERVRGARVSANLFSTLGIDAAVGRTFLEGEDAPGANDVVVLSHGLWRQRFAEDPRIIGREILVDAQPKTIVGVMPDTFAFPSPGTRLWFPYTFDPSDVSAMWGEGLRGGQSIARLGPRVASAEAERELRGFGPRFREANRAWTPPPDYGTNRPVTGLQGALVGDVRTRLLVILGAVGSVLLIACANVAGLLLARVRARGREVALRQALGAGRVRIVRQLLTESTLLGLVGGAAGLTIAFWAVRFLTGALPTDIPRTAEIALDGGVLGYTFLLSFATGLAFGAVPAIRLTRRDTLSSVGANTRGGTIRLGRAGGMLVVGEIAVAVVLVIGAGLLVRSFAALIGVDPGFRTEGILTARVTPPENRFFENRPATADSQDERTVRLLAFYDAVLARAGAIPGVDAVQAVNHVPLAGAPGSRSAFETEDNPQAPGTYAPMMHDRRVTPGYLDAMGIEVLAGRGLDARDREGAGRVGVINETMARVHWPGESPIGKRFKEVYLDEWTTVVGVAADVRYWGQASPVQPEVYRPWRQLPWLDMYLVLRTRLDPATLAPALRDAVAAVDPTVPVSEIRTGEQLVSDSVASPRFTAVLLGSFAGMSLLLAGVGIYGLLSYVVGCQTREIGVRMALGAARVSVLSRVMRHAAALALVGAVVGVGAAFGLTRLLESMLFETSATDVVTFAVVPVAIVGVALLAAWLPASRATRVDPMVVLRHE